LPELTANVKVGLSIIAASAALITGLLGNVLAANLSAFFSGTPVKTTRRPVVLWAAFFVSAVLSVVAGSIATFAPAAPATRGTATPVGEKRPKIVVTNVNAGVQREDTRTNFIICRDTVEFANTSDVPTSLVAVGTELQIDNTVVQFQPGDNLMTWSNSQASVDVTEWKTGPATKKYSNARGLDQFAGAQGEPLPVLIAARSTGSVDVDFAVLGTSAEPQRISAIHILRFPDIEDVKTEMVQCK
jgi:hypothetical protein